MQLSDVVELNDESALKDFTFLIIENVDLSEQEITALQVIDKSLWLDESVSTEKELLERIKNIVVHV